MSVLLHLNADMTALRRSRSVRLVAASAVVLAATLTGALASTHGTAEAVADLTTAFGQGEVLVDPLTSLMIGAVLAAYWGSGFRDGSILWSFLAGPSRLVVAAAGLLASAVVGLVIGCTAMLVKMVTLQLTLPDGAVAAWWRDEHGRVAVVGGVVAAVVVAVVAAALSLVIRNAPVAMAVLFGWLLVIEPLLVGLLPRSWWTWLPGHALSALRNAVPDADLGRAAVMVGIYTTVVVLAALTVTHRRDPA